MSRASEFLAFSLEGQRYALPLAAVERIVRAAEVTPLPNAPAVVLGALDVQGIILPVLSLRRRLQVPDREIRPADQFLIARAAHRTVILVIDEAVGVLELPPERITHAAGLVPGLGGNIHGVATQEDGLVLIHDLDAFLSLDEAAALDAAMSREEEEAHGR